MSTCLNVGIPILDTSKYYNSLRKLVNELGFTGPILWTELVKCESETPGELPPLQTFRDCTKIFLTEELKLIPENCPLIAVGKQVYNALAYRYPSRIVIGVPLPTGSYGHFPKLFDNSGKVVQTINPPFRELWDGISGKAVWLYSNKGTYR